MSRQSLDAKGLLCPLPVLRARKALKLLTDGDVLEVWTTDAASPADFAAFCAATGHRLIASRHDDDGYRFEIEKTSPPLSAGT